MEVREESRAERPEWRRQRARFRLLRWVYDRTGGTPDVPVSGPEIEPALGVPREQLYRLIQYLEDRGYLRYLGAGPRVSISQQGIDYISLLAGRRESIRE